MKLNIFDTDRLEEIWVTITRNKLRSVLTGFGVFWGILMLVILLGSGNAFKNGVKKNFDGFTSNSIFFYTSHTGEAYHGFKKGRDWQMHNSDMDIIRSRVKGIKNISPVAMIWPSGKNTTHNDRSGTYNLKGVNDEYFEIESFIILGGRVLNNIDVTKHRKVCLIGSTVKEELFKKDENVIGEYIRINNIPHQIVGIVQSKSNMTIGDRTEKSIITPITTMQQINNMGDKIWFLCITGEDNYPYKVLQNDVTAVIKERNNISPSDEQALTPIVVAEMFETVNKLFFGISALIWIVGIGTMMSGVIGISNIMMVTVKERTREIGIRRALGAGPFNILSQIMSESLMLTAMSGCLGLVLGVAILNGLDSILNRSENALFIHPEIDLTAAFSAFIILLISGIIAGLIPAWRALKIKAIDAIRDE